MYSQIDLVMFDFLSIIQEHHFDKVLLIVITAFVITFTIIPQIVKLSIERKLPAVSIGISSNKRAVPIIGGIGILIGTIISFLTIGSDKIIGEVISVIGFSIAFSIMGIQDDLMRISAVKKLIVQFSIFLYLIVGLDIRILSFDGYLGINEIGYFPSIFCTLFVAIVLVNAIELIDGIDGLFGSISLFISLFFGWQFFGNEYLSYSLLNFALMGSLLAFLFYNISGKKNKIFSGDGGTYFVGFLLAVSAVKSINANIVSNYSIISLFALPLFDTFLVFTKRAYLGQSPFYPDNNHIHQILLKKTSSHLISTIILVLFSFICFAAVTFIPAQPILILLGLFLVFLFASYYLSKSPLQKTTMKNKEEYVQMPKPDLSELYDSLGLKSNPFSRFSAEEEIDYLDDVYFSPKYFQPLFSDIKNGHTRFILGARGVGKTALIIKLKKQLDKNNVFSIIIDDYEGIPHENNGKYFLENTIRRIVTGYCFAVINSPVLLKRLKKSEKEKLTFFIENFFNPVTKKEFEKYVNATSNYKSRNFWIRACNFILRQFNSVLSLGIEIGGDVIKKSFGLDSVNTTMVYKDYAKELTEYIPGKTIFLEGGNYLLYKDIICDLTNIIKKSGFEQVVIFYDKIDEYKILGGEISKIKGFLNDMLTDTNLLLNKDFGLVFSLWSELKTDLSKIGVRFDKISPIDVTWSNVELEEIMNKRLDYFSTKRQIIIKLEDLVADPRSIEEIISISNKSPRDLLRLISIIYYEQANNDNRSHYLTTNSIKKGILKFISEYDYYSIFPKTKGKDDILIDLKKIISCGKLTFKTLDLSQDLSISNLTASVLIKNLCKHGIIKALNQTQDNLMLYEIIDPKIVWLIKNQINPW